MAEFVGKAVLPTRYGIFDIYSFNDSGEHLALLKGKLRDGCYVRIHSKCTTGDVFHSLRCDCREQLEESLKIISKKGGVVIYLDQEGRGIGLAKKIAAYSLQDSGKDTVEANLLLGHRADEREYDTAAEILKFFGLKKIKLLTNNPNKIEKLKASGIEVERIPLVVKKNEYNKRYLNTKKEKLGHLL